MSMNVPIIDFDFKINLRQPYTYDGVGGKGSSKYDFILKWALTKHLIRVGEGVKKGQNHLMSYMDGPMSETHIKYSHEPNKLLIPISISELITHQNQVVSPSLLQEIRSFLVHYFWGQMIARD